MDDKAEQLKALMKILREEFGIETEAELNAAIAAQPGIDLAPFCAPVNLSASAGQSADIPQDDPADYPAESHKENPRKIRL